MGLFLLLVFLVLPTIFRLTSFILAQPSTLENKAGRTNVLILGVGGAGHEASDLTDTIIFASLDHTGKNPVFISLPRDIWIFSMRAKINTAYHYGNQKKEGGGIILAKAAVSEIIGQPVHYSLVVDFAGFVKTVDLLGGIEIDVERAFDDFKYPIPGRENDDCGGNDPDFSCRFEHIHFDAGKQVMDGGAALKFVRSRNAEGEEGTDFARAVRQQKVILAIRRKLASPSVFLNPKKVLGLFRIFDESIETDVLGERFLAFTRLLLLLDTARIRSEVLNGGVAGYEGFLENPPISFLYDNQWVLIPRDGTWEEVRIWVKDLLSR